MLKRGKSKQRAAEAKKEIEMLEKEATSVEDIETGLPPVEPTKPTQMENQPDKPTQQEEARGDPNLLKVMELLNSMKAVSYTHLDVYKRQCQYSINLVHDV